MERFARWIKCSFEWWIVPKDGEFELTRVNLLIHIGIKLGPGDYICTSDNRLWTLRDQSSIHRESHVSKYVSMYSICNNIPMQGWWADLTVAMAMASASFGSALSTAVTVIRPLARMTGEAYLDVSGEFSSLSRVSGSINWKGCNQEGEMKWTLFQHWFFR